jgi:Ca-activated chloride channel family protein
MTFMWPQFLWLLPVVPLLVLVYGWLSRRKKKLVLRYASVAIVKQAMGAGMGWRRHLPPVLFLLAITALLIAAARPLLSSPCRPIRKPSCWQWTFP